MKKSGNCNLPKGAFCKTPVFDGTSSEEESDASSSHSCEIDLANLGEATWQQKRQTQTSIKMKKLEVPAPVLKVVKDCCFQGQTNAS